METASAAPKTTPTTAYSLKCVVIFVTVVLAAFVIVLVIAFHVEPLASQFKDGVGKYLLIPLYQFVSYYFHLNDENKTNATLDATIMNVNADPTPASIQFAASPQTPTAGAEMAESTANLTYASL